VDTVEHGDHTARRALYTAIDAGSTQTSLDTTPRGDRTGTGRRPPHPQQPIDSLGDAARCN